MSYDLMVFRPDIAPRTRYEFMNWYRQQTQWSEGHGYDDPEVTSGDLKSWFIEMIESYPAMNGPFAKDEGEDNEYVTDYSVGKDVIYVSFSWSLAEQAYEKVKTLAEKHRVGFFDVSADEGDILFPDGFGKNRPLDRPENISSIEQLKNTASPGQEGKSVKEILYSKVIPEISGHHSNNDKIKDEAKRSWWKKLLRLK